MSGDRQERRRYSFPRGEGWGRGLGIVLFVLFVLGAAVFFYAQDYYRADASVTALLENALPGVNIEQSADRIVFRPDSVKAGLIFYPGGKVEYTAYAPLMAGLSQEGFLCILLKMPLNLAVLNMNAAAGIPAEYPDIGVWFLAGHSLGGAMAASYAAKHAEDFDALILLAAYSTADLTDSGLKVLSLYGSEDKVLNREKLEKYRGNLPAEAEEIIIEGGCHAFFGAYGAQKGDGDPRITREEQIRQTVQAVSSLLP
ncbi:MAG: alpha/beta hydrolase [Lachnospiraceae bacterium]|nr:alpha/beta hydrolase [Lachnospiraceae bacterium]